MKKFLLLSSMLNVFLISYFLFFNQTKSIVSKPTGTPIKNIAIFTPTTHPSLLQIERGFIETLEKDTSVQYKFTTYNGNSNRTLMRAQAEEIVGGSYDLIFTIGASTSQLAKELTEKKQRLIPIVFAAVSSPVDLKLVANEEASGNHVTGISEDRNFTQQMEALLYFKPTIKTITLVYNPSQGSGLDKEKKEIESFLQQKNIALTCVEVFQPSEIYQKTAPFITATDAVLVLKDNTVVSGIDALIKLCNQHNVLLYASDLDSGDKGAALSFGVHEYDFGVDSAYKAQLILTKHTKPTDIPTSRATKMKVKVNAKTMQAQGLSLNAMQLFVMQAGEVTGK